MNCKIIQDLIPLYIDGCCSEESQKLVDEHTEECTTCKRMLEDMKVPSDFAPVTEFPKTFHKLNNWKASVLQSVLLFLSFGLITIGVAFEARTSADGFINGLWAWNLVIPATGFLLSLANWYFVRVYKNRKNFSNCSCIATLVITAGAYIWSCFHYDLNLFALFKGCSFIECLEVICSLCIFNGIGLFLSAVFCALSKLLSDHYAQMLGKE